MLNQKLLKMMRKKRIINNYIIILLICVVTGCSGTLFGYDNLDSLYKNNIRNKNNIKNNINNIGKARVNIKEETRDDSSKATDGMEFLEYLWRKD